MTKIRVLRVLEYTYEDTPAKGAAEAMSEDMVRWHVGANATVRHGAVTIRGATLLSEA
jgi:hypothetical protein